MTNKDLKKVVEEILKKGRDIAEVVKANDKALKIGETDNYELSIGESPEKIAASYKAGELSDMNIIFRDKKGKCYLVRMARYKLYDKKSDKP